MTSKQTQTRADTHARTRKLPGAQGHARLPQRVGEAREVQAEAHVGLGHDWMPRVLERLEDRLHSVALQEHKPVPAQDRVLRGFSVTDPTRISILPILPNPPIHHPNTYAIHWILSNHL